MTTRRRTSAVASSAILLLMVFGCNEAGAPPPASQADALATKALLVMLDEAVREVQEARDRRADLREMDREPDVVYVPTPELVVDKMLEVADVQADDVVYDLGCGDGRIVVRAAERYGVKAWGFDIDPERVAEARANVEAAGVEHLVTIEQADIFDLDLSPASVVTLYLLPELNVRLIPQLQALEPGSRVVSHDFGIEGVAPLEHLTLRVDGDPEPHEVFLWNTPLELPVAVEAPASGDEPEAPTGDETAGATEASESEASSESDAGSESNSDDEPADDPRQELRSE